MKQKTKIPITNSDEYGVYTNFKEMKQKTTDEIIEEIANTKKPKLMNKGHTDEIYTPKYAIKPLLPFLKKDCIIYENAWGKGHLANHFIREGFRVVGSGNNFDIIITNPPYSKKDEWLKKCYEIGKPFALLMPLTALEGIKRGELYKKYGIQLIIPNRRIDFIMPNKQGSSWFQVAWFCWGLNLPEQLNFVTLKKQEKKND